MADLVMIATMAGFVLLCIAYVHWCDGFIAADQADAPGDELTDRDPVTPREQVSA